jgi:hypothetical protein
MRSKHLGVAVLVVAAASCITACVGMGSVGQAKHAGGASIPRVLAPRSCSTADRLLKHALVSHGYYTMCGPASAVIRVKGTSYAIHGGNCADGVRLYFGVLGPGSAPHRGFFIDLAHKRAGAVDVTDGEVEFVPGVRAALSGTALVKPGPTRGTFDVYGRSASGPTGSKFTGSWTCS